MASWHRTRFRSGLAVVAVTVVVSIPSLASVVSINPLAGADAERADPGLGYQGPGFRATRFQAAVFHPDIREGGIVLAQAPSPPIARPPVPAGGSTGNPGGSAGSSPNSTAGDADTPAAARLAVRISDLESALRDATGRIEELTFKVKQLEERLDKFQSDVEYRLDQPGGGGAASGSAGQNSSGQGAGGSSGGGGSATGSNPTGPKILAPPSSGSAQNNTTPPPATATPSASASASPREAYAVAYSLLQQGKQPEAEAAFKDFLKRFPDDPLASNARYWLGETYYARADYSSAAVAFLDAYEKDKRGAKAPDALLKLGLSLSGLSKTDQACATFKELARAFPDASQAIKDRAAQERKKLSCPS